MPPHTLTRTRWWQHPEPWLLSVAPLAAVIAGSVTWWLAAHTTDSLVVDDYYRQGKAINLTLARDDEAARRGINGLLRFDAVGRELILSLAESPGGPGFPELVRLDLTHSTRAELDQHLLLRRGPDGLWRSAFAAPATGRWRLQVGEGRWRLQRSVEGFDLPVRLEALPAYAKQAQQPSTEKQGR